jgi:hypothetical protein
MQRQNCVFARLQTLENFEADSRQKRPLRLEADAPLTVTP